eukprot:TRINITY_DN4818_c0_g1_i5.p1 TRINITY_DN4818_c0_g1~~TRINITY_DN4818_c0_g1_i5.p1  ORF type:complete len:202 (+),score=30.98 TRINITY_DN4818_c0_g1_i5:169-774(+)
METNRLIQERRFGRESNSNLLIDVNTVPRSRYGMIPDPSEIEVAQLMVTMSTQKPFIPSPSPTVPPPLRTTFMYHPTMQGETSDLGSKRGRRSGSPKKLVASPSRTPCPNCGIESSTLWRSCDLQNGSHYLCNACGLRYKKGKYCPLCFQVYYDADCNHTQWKQCHVCLNWTHKSCLQKCGLVHDPYICGRCTGRGGSGPS